MSLPQMEELAAELRQEIIENTSKTGGHLASNLGSVELTIALHRVFDSPQDKIIWDVGHQTYAHKMLTGRRDKMQTIRQFGGLSGFPKRAESVHDMYDSGHSGTSVSAALGYAKARDLKGEDYACVAVIGDGALTGGVAYEALNSAGNDKTPLIVILNDNEMSISENVGAVSEHLHKLRTSRSYLDLKKGVKSAVSGSPRLFRFMESIRNAVKFSVMPGALFEELGFKYYGPVDGHDIGKMIPVFELAKELRRPVLIHVITKKGKGFGPAEENPEKYHGVGSFDPKTANALITRNPDSWSEVFGAALSAEFANDSRVAAVTAAMREGTGLAGVQEKYPSRVFDAGIAEQHAVSFAAGLALNGIKPVVAIYSTFFQRAYDQLLTEICLQELPVVFGVDRAGVTGADGETHQGIFDIGYFGTMPGLTLLSPRDAKELAQMLHYALQLGKPCAIRYGRGNVPVFEGIEDSSNQEYRPMPQIVRKGGDVLIVSDGGFLPLALQAADMLTDSGIGAAVCDIKCIKPFPEDFAKQALCTWKKIVTIEDGSVLCGFGKQFAAIGGADRVLNLGWPDKFIQHGSVEQLRELYGLTAADIAEKTEKFI